MKKFYTLLLIFMCFVSFGQTFYSENMGIPGATTPVATYAGWQNTSQIIF